MANANMANKVHIPVEAVDRNIHVILELMDEGIPALTVYRRMVLEVDYIVKLFVMCRHICLWTRPEFPYLPLSWTIQYGRKCKD